MLTAIVRDLKLAVKNLLRNRARSFVAVMTVASGVIAFLLAGGFIEFIFQDMRDMTIHSQLGHAQIVRPGFFEKGLANPNAFLLPSDQQAARDLRALPGVVSVSPRLMLSGLINRGDATVPFFGEGIDPVQEMPISRRVTILSGDNLKTPTEKAVLLGEGLAKSLEAQPGDTVVLLVTTASGSPGAVELVVSGVFSTISKEYDDSAIRLPIETARPLMRVSGATSWVVLLDDDNKTASFLSAARTVLPATDFEIIPWTRLADFYNKTVVLFSKQINVMKIIIGLIIILTITNTLTMSVMERTTEIGTSLAIGLDSLLVMRLFVFEALLIGLIGGLSGVALGTTLAMAISSIGIPMPPPPGMAHGYIGQIVVTPPLVIDAVMLSMITTLLASALPAWKAGRMNIVDALRYSQ